MKEHAHKFGDMRTLVEDVLKSDAYDQRLSDFSHYSTRRIINPILSFLYSPDERVKWRAVAAVGAIVAQMADEEMEAARVIMRRLIWSLNDESGGIGWGSPEAMGEIMARHGKIAEEYAAILISYIREDGNQLENELLERGVLWGVGRLAQARPHMVQPCIGHLLPYLSSRDFIHRGFSLWALGFLDVRAYGSRLEPFLNDPAQVRIFEEGHFIDYRLCELAARALRKN